MAKHGGEPMLSLSLSLSLPLPSSSDTFCTQMVSCGLQLSTYFPSLATNSFLLTSPSSIRSNLFPFIFILGTADVADVVQTEYRHTNRHGLGLADLSPFPCKGETKKLLCGRIYKPTSWEMLGLLESDTKRKSLEGDDDPTMREYGLEILALALPLPVWEERRGAVFLLSQIWATSAAVVLLDWN
ncbi:uncharacterized protein BO66DRAFT_398791 [Aspergillus aculeatinus CBS 121060]|uniref:Uncharacterized protein n=1 Tax=Aspergillus aculeatinus CBS 121060 TaxID=1448322 RepID=A0ACD1HIU5_9EURO|nr:hypothetical protein BO66DRAFT_398791 [Aspergillus aculeatinus CBS 121060]RAH73496.1 hypothetical protein BO66DRAFT_398791 [Aspergillus aculeatinus CBS 121060]